MAPVLIYIGVQRAGSFEYFRPELLIGASIALFLYHSYRCYKKLVMGDSSLWVNLIHMLVVAPLLLWIGYYGKETSRAAYELLLMTGFAALGYHLYNLALEANTVTADKS